MSQKKILVLTGVLMVAIAGWLYQTYKVMGPRIEAESGTVKGPMKIVKDANRSGGGYIKSSGRRTGKVTYLFHIDQHGIYKINAKAYGHSDNGDSFYVTIDAQPEVTWDVGSFDRKWNDTVVTQRRNPRVIGNTYPVEVELTPGTHVLTVREREPNAGLDYFQFEMVKPVVAASFLSGFHLSHFIQGALALCLVSLSLVAIRLSRNVGAVSRRTSPSVDVRLNALDKRISDMQEIMISLDEQLKRQKTQSEDLVETL